MDGEEAAIGDGKGGIDNILDDEGDDDDDDKDNNNNNDSISNKNTKAGEVGGLYAVHD